MRTFTNLKFYLCILHLTTPLIVSSETDPVLNETGRDENQRSFKYVINITLQNLNEKLYIEAHKAESVIGENRNILDTLKQIDMHLYYGKVKYELYNTTSIYDIIIEIHETSINALFSTDLFHYQITSIKLIEENNTTSINDRFIQHRLIVMNRSNVNVSGDFRVARNEVITDIAIIKSNELKSINKRNAKRQYVIEASIHITNEDANLKRSHILYIIAQVNQILKYPLLDKNIKIILQDIYEYPNEFIYDTKLEKTFTKFTQYKYEVMRDLDLSILITKHMMNLKMGGKYGAAISGFRYMCIPNLSVLITQYEWFKTAANIAHELGHLLGARHDMDTGCNSSNTRGIMHYDSVGIQRNRWSACSSRDMDLFLNSQWAVCLLSNNIELSLNGIVELPGYDLFNEQCGPYPNTIVKKRSNCSALTCVVMGTKIVMSEPPLEGTPCQIDNHIVSLTPSKYNRLCYRGICLSKSEIAIRPSFWGPWGQWAQFRGYFSTRNRTCLAQNNTSCYGSLRQGRIKEITDSDILS